MRSDGQHRRHAPMGIEQTVNEMQISRAAASRANGQFVGELPLGSRRKCRCLFVADMNPLNSAIAVKGVSHRIKTVADDAGNLPHPSLSQPCDQFFGHCSRYDGLLLA